MQHSQVGDAPDTLLTVLDTNSTGWYPPELPAAWSDYYKVVPREPTNTRQAWWVTQRHHRRPRRVEAVEK
jgi:hypothetical protein